MESVMHLFGPFFYITGLAWAAATAGFATLWLRARARATAAERRLAEGGRVASAPALAGGEMQQVQASLDAIAVEVERLGEGQRFTTNLLAGRQAPGGAPSREHTQGEQLPSRPNDR